MSAINVNSITGRTGTHGPVLTGVTTISGDLHVGSGLSVTGVSTFSNTVVGGATTELVVGGDARITGILTIGTGSVTIDGTSGNSSITGVTTVGITSAYITSINDLNYPTAGSLSNRNLIINGAIEVSQRGTGFVDVVDVGPGHYLVDRFKAYHFAGTAGSSVIEHSHSTDAPDGFKYSYLARVKTTGMTASDGYTLLGQNIEGYNMNSLDWGSASGKSTTLSFWAKSSEIGTFCVAFRNDGGSRSYVKTFDLDDTNWNFVSFTVPAETTGTWNSTNGRGIQLTWGLDVGTNYEGAVETWLTSNAFTASGMTNTWTDTVNNTFQITGVQLEVGSKATPFEHENYGQTLAKCQRYYFRINGSDNINGLWGTGFAYSSDQAVISVPTPVTLRVAPTAIEQSGTAADYRILESGNTVTCTAVPAYGDDTTNNVVVAAFSTGNLTAGQGVMGRWNTGGNGYLAWSVEL